MTLCIKDKTVDDKQLCDNLKKIETVVAEYFDLIGSEAAHLKSRHSIQSADTIQMEIENKRNQGRLLRLGIVGRVKSGKSSLLNALIFDGKDVLPQAATPMTAALTTLSYGNKFEVGVDFFTQNEIAEIAKKADFYEKECSRLTEEKHADLTKKRGGTDSKDNAPELKEKARRQAEREMQSNTILAATYDQFNKMKESSVDTKSLSEGKKLAIKKEDHLNEELKSYVAAGGKYMPYTKSVQIFLPLDSLKDFEIIDTPGINDPVQSREIRTQELIGKCDAVFIVSPSGQFLSTEDLQLMDRITLKEGIQELNMIASQVDTQLYGSEKRGTLHETLDNIVERLNRHMHNVISNEKEKHPEIGKTFDSLLNKDEQRVLHSAGLCFSMMKTFKDKDKWDSGKTTVWDNLKNDYPDNFSDSDIYTSTANLSLLANMDKVHSVLNQVRQKKEEILKEREIGYLEAKYSSFEQYRTDISQYIKEQIDRIQNNTISSMEEERTKHHKTKNKAANSLNDAYFDCVENFHIRLKEELKKNIQSYFKETDTDVDSARSEKTESYEYDTARNEFTGFFKGIFGRLFGTPRYETRTRAVASIRTSYVKRALNNLINKLQESLSDNVDRKRLEWKQDVSRKIVSSLRSCLEDEDVDMVDENLLRRLIRNIIEGIEFPDINYNDIKTKHKVVFSRTGELTDQNAEEYIDEVNNFINELRKQVMFDINSYLNQVKDSLLKNNDPSSLLFDEWTKEIKILEEQIKNKKLYIDRLNNCSKRVEWVV